MATEVADSSEDTLLQLNPNSVTEKKEEHSALGDIYGISVFSDEFKEKEEIYKKSKDELNDKILQAAINKAEETNQYDSIVDAVLSTTDKNILADDYDESSKTNQSTLLILYCFFGGISLMGLFILFHEKYKRKRSSKNEDNFDNYYIEDETVLPSSGPAGKYNR